MTATTTTTATRTAVRLPSLVVAAVALLAFAGVGFLVGRSNRSTPAHAASVGAGATATSYLHAERTSYRLAWQRYYDRGWTAGIAAGETAGTRTGRSAARAQKAIAASPAQLLAATISSTPARLKRSTKTAVCISVGGGLCEVLGPAVTGKPCPPSSLPNPRGGLVCIPRVLLLAARASGSATPNLPPAP